MSEIKQTEPIFQAEGSKGRVWLTMYRRLVLGKNTAYPYYFVARGKELPTPENKFPDAVVIVAVHHSVPGEHRPKLILIDEFRPAIGCREIGFPAGLIDPEDYSNLPMADPIGMIEGAAKRAAVREMKEETGLVFVPTSVSPPNLYSSAGMTNESVIIVLGNALGSPSQEHLDSGEDIATLMVTKEEVQKMIGEDAHRYAFGKVCWPFLWAFARGAF